MIRRSGYYILKEPISRWGSTLKMLFHTHDELLPTWDCQQKQSRKYLLCNNLTHKLSSSFTILHARRDTKEIFIRWIPRPPTLFRTQMDFHAWRVRFLVFLGLNPHQKRQSSLSISKQYDFGIMKQLRG